MNNDLKPRQIHGCNQPLDTPTGDSLKSKQKTRIACWNVKPDRQACPSGKGVSKLRPWHPWGLQGSLDRVETESISLCLYHIVFRQIGWSKRRGSDPDHEQGDGEDTHWMEIIRVEVAQGQVQLKGHQPDGDCVLCSNWRCRGSRQEYFLRSTAGRD